MMSADFDDLIRKAIRSRRNRKWHDASRAYQQAFSCARDDEPKAAKALEGDLYCRMHISNAVEMLRDIENLNGFLASLNVHQPFAAAAHHALGNRGEFWESIIDCRRWRPERNSNILKGLNSLPTQSRALIDLLRNGSKVDRPRARSRGLTIAPPNVKTVLVLSVDGRYFHRYFDPHFPSNPLISLSGWCYFRYKTWRYWL